MNKAKILNIAGPLRGDAMRILRDVPGVAARRVAPKRRGADYTISATGVSYAVEVKARRIVNAAIARQLAEYAKQMPKGVHLLVVAQATTEEARHVLDKAGVAVIDTLGNIRIAFPHLFVWTEGSPAARGRDGGGQRAVKLTGKAGVVVQALLSAPERKWSVHELADAATVSVGLAHQVLVRLEREQLVAVEGAGPKRIRRIANPSALLDLWAEEMRDLGVTHARAFRLARDPRAQVKALSQLLSEAQIEHAVTGPAGAAALAPHITAIPVTDIWVAETVRLEDVVRAAQAETVREGHNVVFRQATGNAPLVFRQRVNDVWLANRFRLFLDLRQDPRRGREQADRLREEVIGF